MPVIGQGDQRATTVPTAPVGTTQPASPTTAAAASQLASPNWQNQIAGMLAGEYAPTEAQYGLSGALGSAQLGLDAPQLAVSSAELTNSTGFSLANALLGEQGIGIQEQGLGEQAGTAAAQQGLSTAEYGVSATQYPEQQQEAALQNANAQEALSAQGATSGTLDTQGHKQAVATQQAQYGWQQADIFRAQQIAALGQQSSNVGYQGQEEQLANSQAQLGVAAQGQGLDAQQATDQLSFGLQQLGVSAEPEQYLAAISNAQGSGAQQLAALGSQASLIGGLGPNFLGGG